MVATRVVRIGPTVALSAAGTGVGALPSVVTNPGVVNGQYLIAIQSQKNTGTSASMLAPTGWLQRGSTGGSGTVGWMKIWYTRATDEASTWSFPSDADSVVTVLAVSNWDDRDGSTWHVEPTFNTGLATNTHVSNSMTLTDGLCRQFRAFASNSGGNVHSTPAGMTEHQDNTVAASHGHSVDSVQSAGTGSTGTVSSTASVGTLNQNFVTVAFALSSPPDSDSALYAPSLTLGHWCAEDDTVFALIGANSAGSDGDTACQVSSVVDDAHNIWQQGVTKFQTATNTDTAMRGAIWYCAGAKAFTKITVTMTEICDSLGVEILEFTGMTNVSPVDVTNSGGSVATTTQNATGTTVTAADVIVAMAVNGESTQTLAHTADTWTATTGFVTDSQISTDDDTALIGAYKILAAAGAQTTTFTNSSSSVMAWCVLALKQGSVVTTNPNPNWPVMVHEAGFGYDPNDPSVTIAYTAVTSKVVSFATQRGRNYEFGRTEAGEADIRMNNFDGRFDPMNTGSPYYPNVKVYTPYRMRAVWNGDSYNIFTGYVERWPQKWEDQRGTSRMMAVDGLATLAGTTLAGALGEEIIADNPWAYWPLDDGRLAEQAANKSTTHTTPLSIATSTLGLGTAGFGYAMALQSEDSTCWEQDRNTTAPVEINAQYGKCLGATMDMPQLASGILVETWASIKASTVVQNYTIFAIKATGFTSNADRRVAVVQMDASTGAITLFLTTSGGALYSVGSGVSGINDGRFHHYVLHMTTTTARLWIDGVERITYAPASVPASTIDHIGVGGEVDGFTSANIASAAQFAHVAIFQLATVDARRIAARANAGLTGFPEKTGARIRRILNYGGWAGPAALDEGLSFLGATSTIPRQTLLAAAQDVASWENGLAFVDGSGNFRFVDRYNRFNQNIKYIFGGNPGEIPYETDVEIDFDPRYVFNDVTVTRVLGTTPGTGATTTGSSSSHIRDQASIRSYFTKTQEKTSGVASISQCQDEAQWVIENYAQPRARLAQISFTPSANPTLWPVALGIEIGDRVIVRRQPFGGATITLDCYVEQVGHQVKPNEWKVVLSLSPVLLTTYTGQDAWLLDASTLNVDTVVGSP